VGGIPMTGKCSRAAGEQTGGRGLDNDVEMYRHWSLTALLRRSGV
jgi:hypothetical protein